MNWLREKATINEDRERNEQHREKDRNNKVRQIWKARERKKERKKGRGRYRDVSRMLHSYIERKREREGKKERWEGFTIYYIYISWPTVVEVDPKALFSIATTLKCREKCYSFPGTHTHTNTHTLIYIYIYIYGGWIERGKREKDSVR